MYHYYCTDRSCPDPTVPAPYSTGKGGGFGVLGYVLGTGLGGGQGFSAQADPNGASSGVWYFASSPNVPPSGFNPITVSIYRSAPAKFDQVTWEPAGSSWKVVVLDNTCKEDSTFSDTTSGTCTVLPTAKSQNYCVVYDNYTSGSAVLLVNGDTTTPTNTPPPCSLP